MAEEWDPLKTSSGGWDDFDCTWSEVRFGFNPAYTDQEGNLILVMQADFITDDSDIGDNGVLMDQVITIGKGWQAEDDGARVVRVDGKRKGYNNQTYLGLVLDRCMELDERAMRDRYESTGLTPQDAGFWEGMRVHMEQEDVKGFDGTTRSKLLPTKLDGWKPARDAKPVKAAAKKRGPGRPRKVPTPAATGPVEAEKAVEDSAQVADIPADKLKDVDPYVLERMIEIARQSGTDEEFIDRCYGEIAGLDESGPAMALVDDVESPDSVWALHGGAEAEA